MNNRLNFNNNNKIIDNNNMRVMHKNHNNIYNTNEFGDHLSNKKHFSEKYSYSKYETIKKAKGSTIFSKDIFQSRNNFNDERIKPGIKLNINKVPSYNK